MTLRFWLGALSLVAGAAGVAAGAASWLSWSGDRDMERRVASIREAHKLPALAVVVVKGGRIRESIAVGVRKYGDPTPVTIQDQFHLGSETKSMTATLAAIMIEAGEIRWDSTLGEVFPELKAGMDPQYPDVTLEQLLQHRGGVPAEAPPDAWAQAWQQQGTPMEQRYEFIRAILSRPPEAQPGSKMIYSNQGYAVAGAMLEKVSGKPWEDLMTQRLFQPLHMESAGFGPPGTPGAVDQPWGHAIENGAARPSQGDNPPAIAPAARAHCSLPDLARYTIFHMEGEREAGLLKPETMRRLHTPPAGGHYACGWIAVPRGWAGGMALNHGGSNKLWLVVMWLAPKKDFSVVVGANIAGDEAAKGCDEVIDAMIGRWAGS
jgi:CubicO group peptidase (beta-lactamase class C family)